MKTYFNRDYYIEFTGVDNEVVGQTDGRVNDIHFSNKSNYSSFGQQINPDGVSQSYRVRFIIYKKFGSLVGRAKIDIFNIDYDTVSELISLNENATNENFIQVSLYAGYNPYNEVRLLEGSLGLIFKGRIYSIFRKREGGTDIITTLDCSTIMDNKTSDSTMANRTYKKGTRIFDALTDLCRVYGVEAPLESIVDKNKVMEKWQQEVAISIEAKEAIKRIGEMLNLTLSFDGLSQSSWLPLDPTFVATDYVDVDLSTGMVGQPQINSTTFVFAHLINPEIKMFTPVRLLTSDPIINATADTTVIIADKELYGETASRTRTKELLGYVAGISTVGDTFGGEWYTRYECKRLSVKDI